MIHHMAAEKVLTAAHPGFLMLSEGSYSSHHGVIEGRVSLELPPRGLLRHAERRVCIQIRPSESMGRREVHLFPLQNKFLKGDACRFLIDVRTCDGKYLLSPTADSITLKKGGPLFKLHVVSVVLHTVYNKTRYSL